MGSGGALELAKAVTNSLWGQFAMNGEESALTRWTDDKGNVSYDVPKDPRRMPHAWTTHIAAETTARVRSRLLSEGLYGPGPGRAVHVDTDGIVVRQSHDVPGTAGVGPGHWRLKAAMRKVDIRAPQLYRWTCGTGCGVTHARWHYVAAGVPHGSEAEVFERDGQPPTPIGHRGIFDVCLPACHSADAGQIEAWLREAKALV